MQPLDLGQGLVELRVRAVELRAQRIGLARLLRVRLVLPKLGAHLFGGLRACNLHGLGEPLVGFLLRRGELFAKPTGCRRAAPVLSLRDPALDLGRIEALALALILDLDLARLPLGAGLGELVRGLLRAALGLLGAPLGLARASLGLAQATLDRLELAGGLVLRPLEVLLEGEDLVDRPLLGALGGAPRGEPDPFGDVVVGVRPPARRPRR